MFRALASRFFRSGEPVDDEPAVLLSVVMPVYNVAEYLAACLDSLLEQPLTGLDGELQVIAVDDGSTDGSAAILAEYAERDPRVRVLRQQNAGQGPARNRGVELATGRYLMFVDADDLIPPGALRDVVGVLEQTGSDFAVTAVRRVEHGALSRSWTDAVVHDRDRLGVRIADFPAAVLDVIAGNRMFRREFWTREIGGFDPGAYEDHAPMVAAYVRAERFDVLAEVGYHWRIRETRTSTSQRKGDLSNLRDRLAATEVALAQLQGEAEPEVLGAWAGRVVGQDLSQFLAHAAAADEGYRHELRQALARYVALETPASADLVRAHQKVRTWLAGHGDWDALERLDEYLADHGVLPSTVVADGRVLLGEEIEAVVRRGVPPAQRELAAHQTELDVEIARARWHGEVLELVGRAFIRGLDRNHDRQLRIALRGPDDATRSLDVLEAPVDWLTGSYGEPNLDYARGGFRVRIDTRDLAPGRWTTHVRLSEQGIVREGAARRFTAGSSAAPALLAAHARVEPRWDGAAGFVLEVSESGRPASPSPPIVLRDAAAHGERLRLAIDGESTRGRLVGAGVRVPFDDGEVPLVDPETGRPLRPGGYQLRVRRRPLAVDAGYAARLPFEVAAAHHTVRLTANPGARVTLLPPYAADERGRYAQRRLELWARDADFPPEDAVHVDGVALAPDGRVTRWVVRDLGAPVPAGAEPLLRGSRAWHRSLAAARVLVLDTEPGPFWRKRPHQRLVLALSEVVPTTPSVKSDRTAAPSAGRLRREAERRNRDWDAVLVPDASTADQVRDLLGFTGTVLVGDPADEAVRAQVLPAS